MAKMVGFESARIGVMSLGKETFAEDKIYTINAQSGRTLGANIQNLGNSSSVVWASDTPRVIRGKGTGNVTCTLTAENIPEEVIAAMTGTQKNAQGIYTVGADTMSPYCSMEMISHDEDGKKIYLALLKGTFSFPDQHPQTNTVNQTEATDSIVFTGAARMSDSLVYAKGYESDTEFQEEGWNTFVFPPDVVTP